MPSHAFGGILPLCAQNVVRFPESFTTHKPRVPLGVQEMIFTSFCTGRTHREVFRASCLFSTQKLSTHTQKRATPQWKITLSSVSHDFLIRVSSFILIGEILFLVFCLSGKRALTVVSIRFHLYSRQYPFNARWFGLLTWLLKFKCCWHAWCWVYA